VIHLRIATQQELLRFLLASSTGRATSENGWRSRCATWWADSRSARWDRKSAVSSLDAAKFELSGTELTSGSSLLLKHLLFVGVGVADLDNVLFSTGLGHWSVVELLDDVLAHIARLKAAKISTRRVRSARRGLTERSQLHVHCRYHPEECEQSRP
jgi:hypothetical protein